MVIKRYAAKSRATPKPPVFTCKWDTTQAGSSNDTVVLPLMSNGSYNFQIDWGDGTRETITAWNQSEKTHQYASTGIYEVRIIGGISGWDFNNQGDDDKIIEISSWGPLTITDGYRAFYGCSNLELTATDAPTLVLTSQGMRDMFNSCLNMGNQGNMNFWDTSSVTNMLSTFQNCGSFNQPIGNWDVSNVTDMQQMFRNTTGFNQPIGDWDTSSVTDMSYMFQKYHGRMTFDQDIGNWDVSNVNTMREMFQSYRDNFNAFNNGGSPSISGWDTSSVTDMQGMFKLCSGFNQPIGNWDTSKVTNMYQMLYRADSFDQDLGGWDMTGVTDLSTFFESNPVFNNGGSTGINNWRPSSCTNMRQMFRNATGFNQPIGDWDTSSVTNMTHMFEKRHGAMTFDQDVGNWDVSNVTDMSYMFRSERDNFNAFNNGGSPSISGWDTSSVTNMQEMFKRCNSFDQSLSGWDVSSVTNANSFMVSCTLSTANYDSTLVGWSSQSVQNGVNIHFGNSQYSSATGAAYRTALINAGWTITDGGSV